MSLAALTAWAERRGQAIEVEEVSRIEGYVHLRIWADFEGEQLFKERAVSVERQAATLDELAGEWLEQLRGGPG